MDLILLISIFVALLAVLLSLLYLKNRSSSSGKQLLKTEADNFVTFFPFFLENPKPAQQQQAAQPAGGNLVRNQRRNRVRAAEPQAQHAPAQQQQQNDSEDEAVGGELDEKMGAKKRAKLEAKAEKRAQREAELKSREEQKKRDGKSQDFFSNRF